MSFTPIETQEQFDEAISRRLEQKEAQVRREFEEKYADYEDIKLSIKTLTEERDGAVARNSEFEKSISELNDKVAKYETDSVKTEMAIKHGLPFEMAGRLSGSTKEEIEEDALNMAKYMKSSGSNPAPAYIPEPGEEGKKTVKREQYRAMLRNMKGE